MRTTQLLTSAAAAATLALLPAAASAESLVGIDTKNQLVTFASGQPAKAKTKAITGLPMGETLIGLDRRPANGLLIALGASSRLYTVDLAKSSVTPIGTGPFTPGLNGTSYGFDFNPTVDRIRVVSTFTQNLRLQPDTGAVAATDGQLTYAPGDPNAGKPAGAAGAAYTNNVAGATSTQLFDIDVTNDVLALQDPPNAGGLKTVGRLGVDIVSPVGFDISGKTGVAWASLRPAGRKGTFLYRVDLATGSTLGIGGIGSAKTPVSLRALTVAE